jgi:hypothetical protein
MFFAPNLVNNIEEYISSNTAPFLDTAFDSIYNLIVAIAELLIFIFKTIAKYILYPIATTYMVFYLYIVLVKSNSILIMKFISLLISIIVILGGYYFIYKFEVYKSAGVSIFVTYAICGLLAVVAEKNEIIK